jgi:hypothetical protein
VDSRALSRRTSRSNVAEILALQLIVEDDALDARAPAAKTLGSVQVGAIDVRVMGEFAWLLEARVEPLMIPASIGLLTVWARRSIVEFASPRSHLSFLPRLDRRAVMALENVSTFLGQHHERTIVSSGRRDLHESRFLEVPEIARARVERTFTSVAQVASGHNAEGAYGGERSRLGAAQPNVTASGAHGPALGTARQVEVP